MMQKLLQTWLQLLDLAEQSVCLLGEHIHEHVISMDLVQQLPYLGLAKLLLDALVLELPSLLPELLVEELEAVHLVLAPLQILGAVVQLCN